MRAFLVLLVACGNRASGPDAGPVLLTIASHSPGVVVSSPEGIHCGRCDGPPPAGPLMCADTTVYTMCATSFPFGAVVHVSLTQDTTVAYTCGLGYPIDHAGCDVVMDGDKTLSIAGGNAAE